MNIKELITEAKLKTDHGPIGSTWLEKQRDYASSRPVNSWGVPYMGAVTGWFTDNIRIPVDILKNCCGRRARGSSAPRAGRRGGCRSGRTAGFGGW